MNKLVTLTHQMFLYKHLHTTCHFMIRIMHILTHIFQIGTQNIVAPVRVLGSLLYTDEYGFVPGRDICHVHICFQALVQLYFYSTSPAGTVLLYFAKAFNSVVWDALDMVLQHFGFGQNLCRWIKVLFPGTLSSLMFNGRPLDPFELGAGVRQRYPLSPALFVLFIEPFLIFACQKAWTGSPMWILVSFGHQFCR